MYSQNDATKKELIQFSWSLNDIFQGQFHSETISSYGKKELAKLDLNTGKTYLKFDYNKAGPFFDRAYEILLLEEGKKGSLVQNALAHKAMFLEHTGHPLEAEKIYEKIYNQSKTNTDDYNTLLLHASVAHHIGNIYSDYAPEKAMPFLTEARDILGNLLSPAHPDTLDVLNSICSLQLTINDNYSEILSDLQDLLDLYIKVYGPDDPEVGTIHNNIGLCFYYMGQPDEAIKRYTKAVQINISAYGKDHPSTAYIYNNIGAAYSESEHPEKAIPEHKHALKIYETAYPDKLNLDLALTHADLANCYLQAGNGDKTMEHLGEAFDISNKMLPENAHQLIYPYSTLANLDTELEDYENAIVSYSHTLWLLCENGYAEDSAAVQEFAVKISELQEIQNGNH